MKWTEEEIEILKEKYQKQGANIPELLNNGRNKYSIYNKIKTLPISCRYKEFEMTQKLHELIDGLLISDGWIEQKKTTARLAIKQCEKNLEWVRQIQKTFEENNILSKLSLVCNGGETIIMGNKCSSQKQFKLSTRFYITLKNERIRWYNKTKKIPDDVLITPYMLANWYMGDGSLNINKQTKKEYYQIILTTLGFSNEDVFKLKEIINKKFQLEIKEYKRRDGYDLKILKQDKVKEFLEMTYPYKIKCFDYKWKPILKKD